MNLITAANAIWWWIVINGLILFWFGYAEMEMTSLKVTTGKSWSNHFKNQPNRLSSNPFKEVFRLT